MPGSRPELRRRVRAIWFALGYGGLTWWIYEGSCPHAAEGVDGYRAHLGATLRIALRRATFGESAADVDSEPETNARLPLLRDIRLRGRS